jgi:hypothetical protein
VSLGRKHGIGVAMAGESKACLEVASELATFLSEQDVPGDDFRFVLMDWGNSYFRKHYPGDKEDRRSAPRLLIVTPNCDIAKLWQLEINCNSKFLSSKKAKIMATRPTRRSFGWHIRGRSF